MIEEINKTSLIQSSGHNFITQESVNLIADQIKTTHIKQKTIDKHKQLKLYASIDPEGNIINVPSSNKEEAFSRIELTKEFKSIIEKGHQESGIKFK